MNDEDAQRMKNLLDFMAETQSKVQDTNGNVYRLAPKGALALFFASLTGDMDLDRAGEMADSLELFLASAGFTILPIDDVEFRSEDEEK